VPARISHLDMIESIRSAAAMRTARSREAIEEQVVEIEAQIEDEPEAEQPGAGQESPPAKAARSWTDSFDKAETIIDLKGLTRSPRWTAPP
jgi:hypothetical protein